MQISEIPRITDCTDLAGKRVLVRAALNVPIEEGEVRDQFRLMRSLATINYLTSKNAKVILAGHVGREPSETLLPVYRELMKNLNIEFTYDVAGADSKNCIDEMQDGNVVLLENLRKDPREKDNDPEFVRQLASLADIYVNDAFADSHRAHASIVGVPQHLPSYAGLCFIHECEELLKSRKPENPALFLLGGAKFDTKMPLVSQFLEVYDHIFIGGALAHDFFVAQGLEVGESLVSGADIQAAGLLGHEKILLPIDVTVIKGSEVSVKKPDEVAADERIVDAGPETIQMLAEHIENAKTILWNGPFGDYEHGFDSETVACAKLIASAEGYSIVGGGDTVASIAGLNNQEQFNFLSTAGGAMLTFLEHGTLSGIDALISARK